MPATITWGNWHINSRTVSNLIATSGLQLYYQHMLHKTFGTNWLNQSGLKPIKSNPPISLFNTYHAQIKKMSFTYPLGWVEGINVWDEIDGKPVNYEFGYISTKGWQTDPNSPIGIWFFIGQIPMPKTCNKDVALVEIVSMTPVKITGLTQTVYYCETLASPVYDKSKFIASGGLLSVASPKPLTRFSIKDYLLCHPLTDDWFVHDPLNLQTSLLQFGVRSFGLVPAEAQQAFSSKNDALDFFKTSYYAQAKQMMLSTVVG